MTNMILTDNPMSADSEVGNLKNPYGIEGTISYILKSATFTPRTTTPAEYPQYSIEKIGTENTSDGERTITITDTYREVLTGFETGLINYSYPNAGGTVTASYLPLGETGTEATETVTVDALTFDVTVGYAEQITRGSLRFTLGGATFVDTAGALYRDPSPETGAGTIAGSLDPSTGTVRLTSWVGGGVNTLALQSLLTQIGVQPVDAVTFRIPASPVKPGTLQLRWNDLTGTARNKTIPETGILVDNDCTILCDYTRGVVHARFGRWYIVDDLTDEQKLESWYSADAIVTINETAKIWRSNLISAESLVYNAVASSYLPPDSQLLGLDAAKLPPDGKTIIYKQGDLVLVHNTVDLPFDALTPNQAINVNRTRLYRATIRGDNGVELDPSLYAVDRATGIITLSAALDLNGLDAPYHVLHTVADLARVISLDMSGRITLMTQLTHDYPAGTSYCSGVLFAGTLQARVSKAFAQAAWTNVWSDSLIGSAPLANYNSVMYPIVVRNDGAYQDRFLVKFTSATEFQVIGENLGLVALGDINTDCEPINSLTARPYFKIPKEGWGLGWATGNCLRFNVYSATYPIDLVRAIQPSQPTELTDCVELLFIGNTDA